MAQVIRLRNVPTPVLDVVYDQVTYPCLMYGGEIFNMVPNILKQEVYVFEGEALATSTIINQPSALSFSSSIFSESEISSVDVTARSF